mgnify:CR=1 FL=1
MAIPKRAYWLRKVVSEEGMSYHISFRDGQGKIQELCVSYDFFMAFRRLELDERKLENWDYRHKEFSDIMEETLNWRALRLPKSIEERILRKKGQNFSTERSIHCQKFRGGDSCFIMSMTINATKSEQWNIGVLLR